MQSLEQINLAFSQQSRFFDAYEEENEILKWMRVRIREHLLKHLVKNASILELNAGTGLDAVFLAGMGFHVFCTDISEGMILKLAEKVHSGGLEKLISYRRLSFTNLLQLGNVQFDHIFSNFGGLNCTNDLQPVFSQFQKILKPGGKVTLVIMPRVCLWELALLLKGNFKVAFRRFTKKGILANIEGIKIPTYYYSVKNVVDALGPKFKVIDLQGLASVSPPPYMKNFPHRFPRLYKLLTLLDIELSHHFPFNRWADHFILTAQLNH